ncbi:MAG: hypothetical protein CND37_05020 [Bacteroidetes bacterium MED-G20]|nr:MAG: hypothetical protein CND37_05020 [Bacteroidetes bacterium MED-G20]|tara:strand:+ start:8747 stop:9274 length:528 start_codon:yes stop_codon:yes gene_type:complete
MNKIIYIFTFLILLSCVSEKQRKINSLQVKLLNLTQNSLEMNPQKVADAYHGFKENLILVRNCVDTLENQFNQRMNNYKGLKKACPQFSGAYKLTKKNLESQSIQIQNFKKDIKNKLIPSDSVFYYMELEEKNIQKIADDVINLMELYEFINAVNDSLYEPIKKYAENICSNKEV